MTGWWIDPHRNRHRQTAREIRDEVLMAAFATGRIDRARETPRATTPSETRFMVAYIRLVNEVRSGWPTLAEALADARRHQELGPTSIWDNSKRCYVRVWDRLEHDFR